MTGDRRTARGQLSDRGDVEVTEHRHRDSARDGRRSEHQHVRWLRALQAERLTLVDTEAVLFVDDDEPEVEELDVVAEQGVRADDDPRRTRHARQQGLATLGDRQLAGQQRGSEPGREVRPERAHDRAQVLVGKHLGRREQSRLATRLGDGEHRPQRHQGLARSHLALDETVHRHGGLKVGGDRLADRYLIAGQRERQRLVETREQSPGRPHRRRDGTQSLALLQQRGLQHERLLEAQALAGGGPVGVRGGAVHEFEGASKRDQRAG